MSPTPSPVLSIRQLSYGYYEADVYRVIFQNIDAAIERGSFVALLGQSGSGKSSLLNLVAGLDRPDSGSIVLADREITGLSERDRTLFRRRHIGFVHQFFNLIPTLTVLENVILPAELNDIPRRETRNRSLDLLAELGLGNRADTYPDRLSGGEQQRVALARALVHDPDLLIADEPTGNLDSVTGRQILDLLDAAVRTHGKTLLVATHSAEVAERADQVWSLRDGALEFR